VTELDQHGWMQLGEPFAHSRNSDLPAVRISTDDAYIVGVKKNPARATREQQSPARSLA
jgi:hypothetical protein